MSEDRNNGIRHDSIPIEEKEEQDDPNPQIVSYDTWYHYGTT